MASSLWIDFRSAWRSLRNKPGATLIILLLLVVGTSGITVIFNSVYSLILADLPFPQQDRLVMIGGNIPVFNLFLNGFEEKESLDKVFSNLAAYALFPATNIIIPDLAKYKEVRAVEVTEEFFETMGVIPLYGYGLRHNEIDATVIISNRFWRNEMMRADNVIGAQVQIDNVRYTIVGIMPDTFDFPIGTDIWMYRHQRGSLNYTRQYLGRLRSGISIDMATRQLNSIKFEEKYGTLGNDGPVLRPLKTVFYGDRQILLWMLGTISVLFLLLVCCGVMGILVTRGMRRKTEMVMRLILGATRGNLVFKLLLETLPLVIVGALLGLWFSEIAGTWLQAQFPMLNGGEVVIPVKIVFFAVIVLIVTIISGLFPALYTSNIDLNTSLKSGMVLKRGFFSAQEWLVGVQLSLTLALLICTGLLLRNVIFNVDIPVGWTSQSIAVLNVKQPAADSSNDTRDRRALFFQEFQHQLETMPEVVSVGILTPIPFSESAVQVSHEQGYIYKTGEARRSHKPGFENPKEIARQGITGYASPEGFKMLAIPLVAGRFFTPTDVANELDIRRVFWPPSNKKAGTGVVGVVIINQTLAEQFWPGESAVGKTIYYNMDLEFREVVGVVRDFYLSADTKKIHPSMWIPSENYINTNQKYLIKLRSEKLMKDFRQRLSNMNTGTTYIDLRSLNNIVSESTANIRLLLNMLGGFALLGVIVAGSGIYATTSLMAAIRNREIGIRIAMGAQFWDILKFALWRGIRVILLGLPLGLFLAWILSRMLSSFVFQLNTSNPVVWVMGCALLIIIVTVAALIPALQATRVNPVDAIRKD